MHLPIKEKKRVYMTYTKNPKDKRCVNTKIRRLFCTFLINLKLSSSMGFSYSGTLTVKLCHAVTEMILSISLWNKILYLIFCCLLFLNCESYLPAIILYMTLWYCLDSLLDG